jgi:uncharacterized protein
MHRSYRTLIPEQCVRSLVAASRAVPCPGAPPGTGAAFRSGGTGAAAGNGSVGASRRGRATRDSPPRRGVVDVDQLAAAAEGPFFAPVGGIAPVVSSSPTRAMTFLVSEDRRRDERSSHGPANIRPMATADGRTSPREVLREHRAAILSLLSERGGQGVRVFGSLVRGDDDARSDIDLLIELPHAGSIANELLTLLGLSEELSELVGARIDVVTPRTMRDEVRDSALAEAMPL